MYPFGLGDEIDNYHYYLTLSIMLISISVVSCCGISKELKIINTKIIFVVASSE